VMLCIGPFYHRAVESRMLPPIELIPHQKPSACDLL
jgi:hypothetical protein